MASRAALGILMPRHMEYNYRQKKATAQSPAQCLQSLMPFPQLSVKLACKIVWLTVPGCHPCQLQTRSSFPFRDFSRSCWSDVCGEGASRAPRNYFMGTSEYFPGNTAARLVWVQQPMESVICNGCFVRPPITKVDAEWNPFLFW